MKSDPHKLFLDQQKIKYKALKALVQRKHEIRINIATASTTQVQKLDLDQQPNADMLTHNPVPQPQTPRMEVSHQLSSKQVELQPKKGTSPTRKEDLYEVIYRQGSKMASIGWYEQSPIKRNSNMSRTYRRRRRSNNQDHATINANSPPCAENHTSRTITTSHLTINNLQLSGFANQEILKNGGRTLSPSASKNTKEEMKYPKILMLAGDRNSKMVEFMLPISQTGKGIFSIANNKINKKWKYQNKREQPQLLQKCNNSPNQGESIANPEKNQNSADRVTHKSLNPHEHPFFKYLKPSAATVALAGDKQRIPERQVKSQFLRIRPKMVIIQHYQSPKREEACRPWSVFRNFEQKLDEGHSPKVTLSSQVQQ